MATSNETYEYYDWNKTLSYDAEVTMVITARGRGKTYGIRKQAIKEALRDHVTFVEVCRYKSELPGVMNGYFDRLITNNEFDGTYFRIKGDMAYASIDESNWELIGYFVSLSDQQSLKKHTFDRVRRIIFDEVILDVNDRYHHYLPNEFDSLVNLIDTITRQRPGEETRARLYLLGNSVDLVNPYFHGFGIDRLPPYGYTWYNNKHFLLHYEDAKKWGTARRETTLIGHMLSDREAERSLYNEFGTTDDFIANKSSGAVYKMGVKYNGDTFAFWVDDKEQLLYVTSRIPKNAPYVYALTLDDQTIDWTMLTRTSKRMQLIAELARVGQVRYETNIIQERFKEVLRLYGLR